MLLRRRWVVAAVLAVAPIATADAATPIDLGPGHTPHVAIQDSGAAHVTFRGNVPGLGEVSYYCRLDPGADACSNPHSFTYSGGPQDSLGNPWPILPGGDRVLVLDVRCCEGNRFVYSSNDGGQTFGDRMDTIGSGDNAWDASGSALYTPAGVVGRPQESILTMGSGPFQATGTGAPAAGSSNGGFALTQGFDKGGSLALLGNVLLATWTHVGEGNHAFWRQWSGTGDVNDPATWGPIAEIDPAASTGVTHLAAGPGGLFVVTDEYPPNAGSEHRIMLRRFTGSGWGPPMALTGLGIHGSFGLAQDADGVLHFAWEETGSGGLRYRRARSSANDAFSRPQTLVAAGHFFDLRMAIAPAGNRGWAAWHDGNPEHAFGLEFTPLEPPVEGRTANAVPTKGRVLVKLPGKNRFVPLETLGSQVPVGSTLDATNGTVRLTLAKDKRGGTQRGDFSKGQFKFAQTRKSPLTTLSMAGSGLNACGRPSPGGAPKAATGARKRRSRSLFSNVRGRFRTRGRHSTATVRGTSYLVKDTCKGTLTKVSTGRVAVRDLALRRTRVLKAGQSYLARPLKKGR